MSSLPPDPYKILGVSKDAQTPEIRSAHRKLVLQCHPDKVQDPALKAQKQDEFQKVQQAYELLSDDKERQRYDDKAQLAELRKQFQNRANTSAPRSSPRFEYEVRTAEPRPTTFSKSASAPPPPGPQSYTATYSRSWEEDLPGRGRHMFEAEIRTSRREATFSGKHSKREADREREKERDKERDKEREKDKERERRRREKEEDIRRAAEKEAKEQRRAEKKLREKQRDKEIKRESEEKRRYAKPFVEPYYEDEETPLPKSLRKKSSGGKKYEEKQDRSTHREEMPDMAPPRPMPRERSYTTLEAAASYIEMSRARSGNAPGMPRSASYRHVQPPAPTPPPAPGQSAFTTPDDDVRRSSARGRREASDSPKPPRERTHKKSREQMEDNPIIVDADPSSRTPSSRHAPHKSTSSMPGRAASPPRRDLPRTNTMPVDAGYSRPAPGISRAQTFGAFGEGNPRGRGRDRMQAQVAEETDSDEEYERQARERERDRDRDRKSRSSRKHRSPDPFANVMRYQVDGGRTKLSSSFTRQLDAEGDSYRYYSSPGSGARIVNAPHPPPLQREGSYMSTAPGAPKFPKIKMSKPFSHDDVQYTRYQQPYREEYPVAG